MKLFFERFKREYIKRDKIFEETIEKEYFFLRVLKDCWIMLFLLLNLRIETTKKDLVLNLNNEWIKKSKKLKILKLCRSLSWISGEQLKRLMFKIFLIDFTKTEFKRCWLNLLSKWIKREEQ